MLAAQSNLGGAEIGVHFLGSDRVVPVSMGREREPIASRNMARRSRISVVANSSGAQRPGLSALPAIFFVRYARSLKRLFSNPAQVGNDLSERSRSRMVWLAALEIEDEDD